MGSIDRQLEGYLFSEKLVFSLVLEIEQLKLQNVLSVLLQFKND